MPHQHKRAAGIDLGTTNSLVATVRNGRAQVVAAEDGSFLLPSVVHYGSAGNILVGDAAKQSLAQEPENTLASFKRWMGRSLKDVQDSRQYQFLQSEESVATVDTAAGPINAVQASAELLSNLRLRVESFLGGVLQGVVITVPAYFDDAQRQATKDAATLAGLDVLRLINEPTAAALAYGIDKQDDRYVAIYDLGGGTFDISILQLSKGVFEVLATGGDTMLGGDDIDQAIVDWVWRESGFDPQSLSRGSIKQLHQDAREAKHQLCDSGLPVELSLSAGESTWSGELNLETFNELIDATIDKTLTVCRRCLDEAELEIEDISDVVMVGGSTRVPLVRAKVSELFNATLRTDVDPDQVVAIGAAMQADALVGNKQANELLLLDVLPLSLGIETMGGLVEKIIPRNTAIPTSMAQEFTTQKDGQTALAIHILQGERERVEDCRSLARFELRGIPPMVAGAARILVTFDVDANGMLAVTASETTTGVNAEVKVQPSSGLKEEQITEMLKASYQFAAADRDTRSLVEQQVEAQNLLDAIEGALAIDADLLSVEELEKVQSAIDLLSEKVSSTAIDEIKRAVTSLSSATEVFAARRMDRSIKQALKGRNLSDFADSN